MKRGLIFTLFLSCIQLLHAQEIPNYDFESWVTKTLYESPEFYSTSNTQLSMMGLAPNVTKSTDKQNGQFSVKLQTVLAGQDTIPGFLFAGDAGSGGLGGVSFKQRPTSLDGFVKHNIKPNDTALILLLFQRLGNIIGMGGTTFTGVQASFISFSAPITFFVPAIMPDTVIMIISSSSMNGSFVPGSILMLDDLQMVGSTAQLPNAGFEDWFSVNSDEPTGWFTSNGISANPLEMGVTKSTDSYKGTYSAKIKNVEIFGGDLIGMMTNGIFNNSIPLGGIPVFNNPDTIKGHYKYLPVGLDTAFAILVLYKYDESLETSVLVEQRMVPLLPSASYKEFSIPVDYDKIPSADTINISFLSGNIIKDGAYVGKGSELYIDQLSIVYKTSGVNEINNAQDISLYPNPASDQIHIRLGNSIIGKLHISLADESGKIIFEQDEINHESIQLSINIENQPAGVYYVNINSENGIYKAKFVIQ